MPWIVQGKMLVNIYLEQQTVSTFVDCVFDWHDGRLGVAVFKKVVSFELIWHLSFGNCCRTIKQWGHGCDGLWPSYFPGIINKGFGHFFLLEPWSLINFNQFKNPLISILIWKSMLEILKCKQLHSHLIFFPKTNRTIKLKSVY